jgi:hypothetical protein
MSPSVVDSTSMPMRLGRKRVHSAVPFTTLSAETKHDFFSAPIPRPLLVLGPGLLLTRTTEFVAVIGQGVWSSGFAEQAR